LKQENESGGGPIPPPGTETVVNEVRRGEFSTPGKKKVEEGPIPPPGAELRGYPSSTVSNQW